MLPTARDVYAAGLSVEAALAQRLADQDGRRAFLLLFLLLRLIAGDSAAVDKTDHRAGSAVLLLFR